MNLFIDTTDFGQTFFAISDGEKIQKKIYKISPQKSHETLSKLNEFLRQSAIRNPQSAIKKIICNKGPGSYTGTRVGVSIAQALGFAWNSPVRFLGKDQFFTDMQNNTEDAD